MGAQAGFHKDAHLVDAGVDRTKLRRLSQCSESRQVRAQAFGGDYAHTSFGSLVQFDRHPYEINRQLNLPIQGEEKELLEKIVLGGLEDFEISALSPHGLLGELLGCKWTLHASHFILTTLRFPHGNGGVWTVHGLPLGGGLPARCVNILFCFDFVYSSCQLLCLSCHVSCCVQGWSVLWTRLWMSEEAGCQWLQTSQLRQTFQATNSTETKQHA